MTNLQEVPTEELLSFHDYPTVHNTGNQPQQSSRLEINMPQDYSLPPTLPHNEGPHDDPSSEPVAAKSFWTLEYYQQFFDVDTKDVVDRIIASVTPIRDNTLKHHLRRKPDLYGPLWISITLIFTIAITGNIADYLQRADDHHKWKYEFHLVSYAATAIYLYIFLLPVALWSLLKWSSDVVDLDGLEPSTIPSILELICVYGYSLFIYIPVSVLWSIQINMFQWLLALIAALVSGSVLVFTLMPALRLSRHKLFLILGIMACHFLLAAGFMQYFFHTSQTPQTNNSTTVAPVVPTIQAVAQKVVNVVVKNVSSTVKSV